MSDQEVVYVERAGNGMAVAGFVCALVGVGAGLIPIMFWLALPLGALGFIFGLLGRGRAKREPALGRKTMATWAVVLGIIAFGLGCWGVAIVGEVGEDLDCIAEADTSKQVDACD